MTGPQGPAGEVIPKGNMPITGRQGRVGEFDRKEASSFFFYLTENSG